MVFFHCLAGGLGQTMDDTQFLPLGQFDLWNDPGLLRCSTWRENSSKLDLALAWITIN